MTPVEWLEAQPEPDMSVTVEGRVCFRGGWTTLAQIKVDACKCVNDRHLSLNQNTYLQYGYVPQLDPYDVAVKRGAPA